MLYNSSLKCTNINSEKARRDIKIYETLRQYSRFVEIVRSYGHIDQLTGAVMVKIMAQCKRKASSQNLWSITERS